MLQGAPTDGSIDTAGDCDGGETRRCDCHIEAVLPTVLLSYVVDDEVALQPVYAAGLTARQVDETCGAVDTNPLLPQTGSLRVSVVAALLRREGERQTSGRGGGQSTRPTSSCKLQNGSSKRTSL